MTDKVYTCIGARNFAKTDRQKEDFYATDFLILRVMRLYPFSWFSWEKGYKGEPKVRWFNYD